jgi:diguanylate cyclase (GGDEF)-like protein
MTAFRQQEYAVQEPWAREAPDGLAGTTSLLSPGLPTSRRRNRSRDGVAGTILAHLPLAVAVIDEDARLVFWNEQAAQLFGAPPLIAEARPALAAILPGALNLTPPQRDRIVAFATSHIAAGDRTEPDGCLRLSLGRAWRIAIQIHGLGAGQWMLVIDDGRVTAAGNPAAPGAGDAWLDPLTGLSNRRHFNRMLWEAVDDAAGEASRAVLLIDLDRFTAVNETLGHAVGDALLCLAARRLRREIRDVDLLARLGGDEFAILIPNGDSAEALAARSIAMLGQAFLVEGHRISIGASVGVVRFPEHGALADELMCHAELALYEAKSAGGKTWRRFDAATAGEVRIRRDLETGLRKALALQELSLVYRSCGDAVSGTLTGFEAKLCWNHPVRGTLAEPAFLQPAAAPACIVELGEWKLRTACAEAARWPLESTVAVEIFPQQLRDACRLVAAVRAALDGSGLDAGRLELRVAEPSLKHAEPDALCALHRVRVLGVRIGLVNLALVPAFVDPRPFSFDSTTLAGKPTPGAHDASAVLPLATQGFGRIECYLADPPTPAASVPEIARRHASAGHLLAEPE